MALHKNAFPLRAARQQGGQHISRESENEDDDEDAEGEEGRLRKRDMVSNMVTGGLASGIGWVLGAQPVNR